MSIDYAKKERAFLAGLKDNTGHALDEWLDMIAHEQLSERNDIIDWLRHNGFTFSRASWLERIHHNGGVPIYADDAGPDETAGKSARKTNPKSKDHAGTDDGVTATHKNTDNNTPKERPDLRVVETQQPDAPSARQSVKPAPPKPKPETTIENVLLRAKGLRPLAQHLIKEVRRVVPDAELVPRQGAIVFERLKQPFAVVALSSKDLRLGLMLAPDKPEKPFQSPEFSPAVARISAETTHMIVLDDVRQLDHTVLAQVQRAASRH